MKNDICILIAPTKQPSIFHMLSL